MKKFIRKLAFYLISLSIILACTDFMIHPKFAGPSFKQKYDYYSQNSSEYDLVFFGSSQTSMQFIPDSLTSKLGISSFNYGSGGMYGYVRNTIFDNLFEAGHFDRSKYLLLEMGYYNPLDDIERLVQTDRGRIFFTFKTFAQNLNYINNLDADLFYKLNAFSRLSKAYVKSRIKVPLYQYPVKMIRSFLGKTTPPYRKNHGYLVYDLTDKNIIEIQQEFIKNNKHNSIRLESTSVRQKKPNTNNVMIQRYLDMIEDCKKRGIHLIWILNPLIIHQTDPMNETYYLKSIFNELPMENRIDLGDPNQYPELFSSENILNSRHLNNEGAKLYSKYLAEELNKIIQN